jgi:hypothetical protein
MTNLKTLVALLTQSILSTNQTSDEHLVSTTLSPVAAVPRIYSTAASPTSTCSTPS